MRSLSYNNGFKLKKPNDYESDPSLRFRKVDSQKNVYLDLSNVPKKFFDPPTKVSKRGSICSSNSQGNRGDDLNGDQSARLQTFEGGVRTMESEDFLGFDSLPSARVRELQEQEELQDLNFSEWSLNNSPRKTQESPGLFRKLFGGLLGCSPVATAKAKQEDHEFEAEFLSKPLGEQTRTSLRVTLEETKQTSIVKFTQDEETKQAVTGTSPVETKRTNVKISSPQLMDSHYSSPETVSKGDDSVLHEEIYRLESELLRLKKVAKRKKKELARRKIRAAITIQKHFRGFRARKQLASWFRRKFEEYEQLQQRKTKKGYSFLNDVVKGWKTRRILQTIKVREILRQIRDLRSFINAIKHGNDTESKRLLHNSLREIFKKYHQFHALFERFCSSGEWVRYRHPLEPAIFPKAYEISDRKIRMILGKEMRCRSPLDDSRLSADHLSSPDTSFDAVLTINAIPGSHIALSPPVKRPSSKIGESSFLETSEPSVSSPGKMKEVSPGKPKAKNFLKKNARSTYDPVKARKEAALKRKQQETRLAKEIKSNSSSHVLLTKKTSSMAENSCDLTTQRSMNGSAFSSTILDKSDHSLVDRSAVSYGSTNQGKHRSSKSLSMSEKSFKSNDWKYIKPKIDCWQNTSKLSGDKTSGGMLFRSDLGRTSRCSSPISNEKRTSESRDVTPSSGSQRNTPSSRSKTSLFSPTSTISAHSPSRVNGLSGGDRRSVGQIMTASPLWIQSPTFSGYKSSSPSPQRKIVWPKRLDVVPEDKTPVSVDVLHEKSKLRFDELVEIASQLNQRYEVILQEGKTARQIKSNIPQVSFSQMNDLKLEPESYRVCYRELRKQYKGITENSPAKTKRMLVRK